MDKAKKNPQLIIILVILLVTGVALAQKFNSVVKPTVGDKVLADEGEDGDRVSEADDEDSNDDEDKNDEEDKDDDEKNSERSKVRTQKDEDEEDDADEVDDDADDADEEDESGEEIKDITELIAKVEKKISLVAASGGSVEGFNATLAEVRDLVVQAQTKLTEGNKAEAENLIETADDKLENLEEFVKLVLGEREDDDDEDEADDDDDDRSEIAKEYKNIVAQFVHDLKAARELEGIEGGIGSQVSSIAQIQNASQDRVAALLDKIDERNELAKFFIGPNLDDLTGIKEEIAKNQATIQILTQMLGQTDNANVKIVLQRQIQVLTQENLKLKNYVAATENVPSMFGWLVRLFS